MMESGRNLQKPQSHPMPGLVSVIAIPASKEGANTGVIEHNGLVILNPLQFDAGVEAGIVIEAPSPGSDYEIPFGPGDTIYYQVGHALAIGDYNYINLGAVVCWRCEE